MKWKYTIFCSINPLRLRNWWSLIVRIFQNTYNTPLILCNAFRLMTRLIGVRPAVDLSWKALGYGIRILAYDQNIGWLFSNVWPKLCQLLIFGTQYVYLLALVYRRLKSVSNRASQKQVRNYIHLSSWVSRIKSHKENPKWDIWLIWAVVIHYTDKLTHFNTFWVILSV